MDTRTKALKIIEVLKKEYPQARTALHFTTPLEILVATILSAQCTDVRVNIVTAKLFKKYRSARAFAAADIRSFEKEIYSTGFYKNKAKNIIAAARMIVEHFSGRVPDTMAGLLELPGVARKTANVVLQNAYGKVEGIVVDTHVRRLAQRLGLTKRDDPARIEEDLMKAIPAKEWETISYLFIDHGRAVCRSQRPDHAACALYELCPSRSI
ncbi:MAG: endonuclease III [Candidatus Omnitrophota bacterium]